MKIRSLALSVLGLLLALPAAAQLPPAAGISIGYTPVQGGTAAQCLYITTSNKVGSQACGTGTAADIKVGTTTVSSGTTTRILYDNAGTLGEYTISGSGTVVAMATAPTISSLTVTTAFTATGLVTLPALATQATNTIIGNATSGTASPTALAISSCSAATSALIWTTNTGFGCNTLSSTYLPLAGGTMTGGIGFSTTNTLDIGTNATTLAPRTIYAGTSFVGPIGTFTTSVAVGGATIGSNAWAVAGSSSLAGDLLFTTDNTYDIGKSGATRPRIIFARGSITLEGPGTITSGGAIVATLANTATTSAICYNTGTGLFTYDGTLGTCTVSALWRKDRLDPVEPSAIAGIYGLRVESWKYKDEYVQSGGFDDRVHVGLYADDVERLDKRCVGYKDGVIQNYDDRCVMGYLVAAVQQLKQQIDRRASK